MFIKRYLDLPRLLDRKSHFLFGPRGTGKSHLIHQQLEDQATVVDLLSDDTFSLLLRRPTALEGILEPNKNWVVIDEIQKIPPLLDEVHRLIEKRQLKFLLTGSSARKLKRGAVNLLGGRAWEARLFPFTRMELGTHFNLLTYLNRGGLPAVYFSEYPRDELKNYVKLYLREEIQGEALTRRMDHFARFLDIAALTSGEEINFEAVANDSGVPSRTVASYFEILEDTLIGFQVPPFVRTRKRKAIKSSKFFFFDVGVAGALSRWGEIAAGTPLFGKALEHLIAQEIRAFLSYHSLEHGLCYWRTPTHLEVDFIVGTELALEIKATERVSDRHLTGLKSLAEEKLIKNYLLVSRDPVRRRENGIQLVPILDFLKGLWEGEWIAP